MSSFYDSNKNNKNIISNDLIKNKTTRVTKIKDKINKKQKNEYRVYRNLNMSINKIKNKRN